jgi:hypothetical protein
LLYLHIAIGGFLMSHADLNIIARRYIEEQAAPSMIGWRSLAYFSALKADSILEDDPESVTGLSIKAISEQSWRNYMDMMPTHDVEQHNSLAGVVLGWFGKLRKAA